MELGCSEVGNDIQEGCNDIQEGCKEHREVGQSGDVDEEEEAVTKLGTLGTM